MEHGCCLSPSIGSRCTYLSLTLMINMDYVVGCRLLVPSLENLGAESNAADMIRHVLY